MSSDTRTERRQARHRRNLVIGSVVGLASVLSAALVGVLLVVGPGEPPSAARSVGPASSEWSGTGDDVWSDAAPMTSVPTSSAAVTGTPSATTGTSGPAVTSTNPVTSTTAAPRRTGVTVVRTAAAPQPPAPTSPSPRPTASTSTTTDVPPGQLKRPKPKTPPPPRR